MKALLVGDNRDILNWGARGQSIALYQMLNGVFEEIEVISGKYVGGAGYDNDAYIKTIMPYKLFKILLKNKNNNFLINSYIRFEKLLGARDIVNDDPEEGAVMVIRFKKSRPGLSMLYDKINECDVVIINGEGSGILGTPYRRDFFFYLMIAELSVKLRKRTFFVNSLISDSPLSERNERSLNFAYKVFGKCNAVALRDKESFEFVKNEMPDVKSHYIPDALFSWFRIYENADYLPENGNFLIPFPEKQELLNKIIFSKPYVCVGGGSLAAYRPAAARENYCALLRRLKELEMEIYLTECCAGDYFLKEVAKELGLGIIPINAPIYSCGAVLAQSRLFISGRFHPTILASLGGTPCIFLRAHSHKMNSLQKDLEYDNLDRFSEMPSSSEIEQIIKMSKKYLDDGPPMRSRISSVCKRLSGESEKIKELVLS